MSAVDAPERPTVVVSAPGAAGATPAAEPCTAAEERWQLEERRRDAYRVG
jgi:hypothetical protein